MTTFDNLPLELVIKIIELSIEDAVALDDFQLTKNILLQLSLVSKDFTLPAQRALWRAIYGMHFDKPEFMRVIGEGLGKDKKIDNLAFVLQDSEETAFDSFLEVLNGVGEIEELILCDIIATRSNEWPSLFSLPSLAGLKRLTLDGLSTINSNDLILPSTLHNLTFYDIHSAESFVSRPSAGFLTIDTISFHFHEQALIEVSSITSLISYFKLHGSKLKTLKFLNFDHFIIPLLLAHTPSLLNLHLESHQDKIIHTLNYIQALPLTTRLSSLAFGQFELDDCIEPNFLLPLVKLAQLSQLKTLWHSITEYQYGDYYEEGHLEELEDGPNVEIAFDKSVKLCKDKGIRLSFYMPHYERKIKELYKQKLYEARQEQFDREQEQEAAELAEMLGELKMQWV